MKKIFSKIPFLFLLAVIFTVAGATPALAIGGIKMVAEKMAPKVTMTALYSSVDVSALAAYAGDYEQQLFSTMVNDLDIARDIRVMPMIKNKLNLTQLTATANAKPFSTDEEYQGSLGYTPRVLEVKQGKTELLIDLESYRNEWMADQMGPGSGANKTIDNMPFAQYTMQELFKSLGAEINNRTAYFGFDSSSTAVYDNGDHPFAVGDRVYQVANGVKHFYECTVITSSGEAPATTPAKWKIVDAEAIAEGLGSKIANSGKTPVNTGAVTTGAEALAAQRKLFRALDTPYKNMGVTLFQSYTDYELLMDGIEDKITKYTRADNTPLTLPGTDGKCIVKPATWLTGSRRLIATPSQNLLMGTDQLGDMNQIKIADSKLWTIPVGIKFGVGFQIRDLGAIEFGDQV